MRAFLVISLVLIFTSVACGVGSARTPQPQIEIVEGSSVSNPAPTAPESAIPTVAMSQAGTIHVDTLDQEVYPFVENGKCSLGEAIFAANAGEPRDSCEAGVINESIIELMPGEYHFTQRDTTPPQVAWAASVVDIGDALPMVVYSLTIRGNGAVLMRDDGAEPFRFFELMFGTLRLHDLTLQNGDVDEDWGGAIYSMNASMELDGVRFVNNHAGNGGAVYFNLGGLTIDDTEFIDNRATQSGGALFIDSSKVTINSTRFEGNESDSNGGGMYLTTVTLVLADGFFIRNRVTGNGYGIRGGGMYASHANLTITGSQFYQNESPVYGGAIGINNPILAGIDPEDGDPIEQIEESPMISGMLTSIPGFQSTLEAHPSGVFVDFHEDAQIHDNCFANNVTYHPDDPNWTSGLLGRASEADGNYWGHPSGPSGMGPGSGDSVGLRLTFSPFLTEAPAFCDPSLAEKQ